jgi:LmbE family N-acetylglucosaminyl deacetylase
LRSYAIAWAKQEYDEHVTEPITARVQWSGICHGLPLKTLHLARAGEQLSVLCLGAHSDDIEIGAGGALLYWITQGVKLDVSWCVLGAVGEREREARVSASDFLQGAASTNVETLQFRNSFFPEQSTQIKEWFEALKSRVKPDVVLTHRRQDAHQDHREIARHTWATFRNHLILEYEIPKWDGDMGRPNVYVALPSEILHRKIELLMRHFASQRGRQWYDEETFRGLARLRGVECCAPDRYAEAFFGSKVMLT